jgi:DNA-binding response OmpR family regulator
VEAAKAVLNVWHPGISILSFSTSCYRESLKQIRRTSDVPVIMLTARGDDVDRIIGLEFGADDYLAKPFNPRELVARIKAILRRSHREPPESNQLTLAVMPCA